MNNNIMKLLVAGISCAAVYTTALAAPHGGRNDQHSRPAPKHQAPQAKGHNARPASHAKPAPQGHHGNARPASQHQARPPHGGKPHTHQTSHGGKPHTYQASHGGRPFAGHTPPPRPEHHKPCGRVYPYRHHIGGRHIEIFPPTIFIDDYYWTEEVLINGVYYILYCYPDGTKRFSDGTIFCYF